MVEKLKQEHDVEVDWRPFYLNPNTPPEGMPLPEYIQQARASGSDERLKQMAAQFGMPFKSTERILNTRLAHEATEYARTKGLLNPFHKAVFRLVYGEGQDISQWAVLRAAALEVGLDAAEMQEFVEAGMFTLEVSNQVQQAYQVGITGVPTYVINQKYAVVGAQPYEVFERALKQIFSEQA